MDKEKANELKEVMERYEVDIYKFSKSDPEKWFRPFHQGKTKLEDGMYLTIRCGLGGIYTMINQWNSESGRWEIEVADDSTTIAYRPERLKEVENIVGG